MSAGRLHRPYGVVSTASATRGPYHLRKTCRIVAPINAEAPVTARACFALALREPLRTEQP